MSTRHEAREWAVQFLFQRDFNRGDIDDALRDFWEQRSPGAKSRAFAEELIRGVHEHRPELDALLKKYTENWDVKRMGAVDRNVLRVALYEMLHRPDIPPVVSINEAVDIAKAFSTLASGRFVNGILDRACKDLQRPARTASSENGTARDRKSHGQLA
jgi:N utilization substance protein B